MIAAVVGPFAEAVRSTFQPCTFLLIAPILAAVLAARARWQALVGAIVGAVVGGWILIDNRWILDGWSLRVSAVLVATALTAIVMSPTDADDTDGAGGRRFRLAGPARWSAVGVIAVIATMWWRPCVGSELGAILNGAQDGRAGQMMPMAAYMLGAMVPVAVVVALRHAVEPPERVLAAITQAGAAAGVIVAVFLVTGRHDDVVVTLTRWTLE